MLTDDVVMMISVVGKRMGNSLPWLSARGSNAEGTLEPPERFPMPSQVQLDCTAFSGS
jgi:hypothetical protein